MARVLIDKIEFKDGEVESEARHLLSMFSLPIDLCGTYLKFITEKGLLPEYIKWREKKVFEILGK